MTRRQWMWLWIWLLLFFIAFCVWNKLQQKMTNTKMANNITSKQEVVVSTVEKDINVKIIKDGDNIKISGIFTSNADLEKLKAKYKVISKNVSVGMIIIDKNAKNDKVFDMMGTLTDDFSKFEQGYLEYSNKTFTIDGIVENEKIKHSIGSKALMTGDLSVDNKVSIKEVKKPKIIKEKEPSKKEIQAKIDNLIKLKKVEFIYAKEGLTAKGKKTIDEVYEILNRYKNIKVEIGGHTDSDGTTKNNQILSQKRADAIKDYLVKKGISSKRLKAIGYGESKPLVKNNSSSNKQKNRRVEFILIPTLNSRF